MGSSPFECTMAGWPSGSGTRLQSASREFDSRFRLVYTCTIAECPACHRGVAVRPLTGLLFRHGGGTCCPGSDQLPASAHSSKDESYGPLSRGCGFESRWAY